MDTTNASSAKKEMSNNASTVKEFIKQQMVQKMTWTKYEYIYHHFMPFL